MQTLTQRSQIVRASAMASASTPPPVLRLQRLWAGSDFGFGDSAACDDYYVEGPGANAVDRTDSDRG
jgi:hypothetical protein